MMKKWLTALSLLLIASTSMAQDKPGNVFQNGTAVQANVRLRVSVNFMGDQVKVINPLVKKGVSIVVINQSDVVVFSTAQFDNIEFVLSGVTKDGSFKIYSDNDFLLTLNGVRLANVDGPAINVQASSTVSVELADGTTSILGDGVDYVDAPSDEDQKAAFFSEGELVFSGEGSLVVNGQGDGKHGLASDDYIEVRSGNIVVASADKDAIRTNDGFWLFGGLVDLNSDGDGVDAGDGPVEILAGTIDVAITDEGKDAIKCDGTILIVGGDVELNVDGDRAKGLNAVSLNIDRRAIDVCQSNPI